MLLCGVAAFFAYAYFYEAGGWNQNTRFDLVRALVEHRSIQIDEYAENSGDKAPFGGHVYADKAPGASFVAAPAVALTRAAMRLASVNPDSRSCLIWQSYVASLTAAALPGALAVMCVWFLARHKVGASSRGATMVALAFGLGTPFWAWASVFYGHTLAALCMLSAFLVAINLGEGTVEPSRDFRLSALIGLLIGWAVVTEFPTAVPGSVIVLFALAEARRGGGRRLVRVASAIGLAGGLCAVVLGGYNAAAFGSPFHVGYASEADTTVLARGFFGFTTPKLSVMRELLWGSYRGLLRLGPVLALVPVGWIWLVRHRDRRGIVLTAAATFLVGFFLNAAYEHWEGGWSLGPRHLGQVLGFAALGLVPVWMYGGRIVRALTVALALVGFAVTLVGVSTTAQPPGFRPESPDPVWTDPIANVLWPAFREGDLSLNTQSYFDKYPPGGAPSPREGFARAQWNLGEKMGLTGLPSLIPLGAGLAVLAGLAFRSPD